MAASPSFQDIPAVAVRRTIHVTEVLDTSRLAQLRDLLSLCTHVAAQLNLLADHTLVEDPLLRAWLTMHRLSRSCGSDPISLGQLNQDGLCHRAAALRPGDALVVLDEGATRVWMLQRHLCQSRCYMLWGCRVDAQHAQAIASLTAHRFDTESDAASALLDVLTRKHRNAPYSTRLLVPLVSERAAAALASLPVVLCQAISYGVRRVWLLEDLETAEYAPLRGELASCNRLWTVDRWYANVLRNHASGGQWWQHTKEVLQAAGGGSLSTLLYERMHNAATDEGQWRVHMPPLREAGKGSSHQKCSWSGAALMASLRQAHLHGVHRLLLDLTDCRYCPAEQWMLGACASRHPAQLFTESASMSAWHEVPKQKENRFKAQDQALDWLKVVRLHYPHACVLSADRPAPRHATRGGSKMFLVVPSRRYWAEQLCVRLPPSLRCFYERLAPLEVCSLVMDVDMPLDAFDVVLNEQEELFAREHLAVRVVHRFVRESLAADSAWSAHIFAEGEKQTRLQFHVLAASKPGKLSLHIGYPALHFRSPQAHCMGAFVRTIRQRILDATQREGEEEAGVMCFRDKNGEWETALDVSIYSKNRFLRTAFQTKRGQQRWLREWHSDADRHPRGPPDSRDLGAMQALQADELLEAVERHRVSGDLLAAHIAARFGLPTNEDGSPLLLLGAATPPPKVSAAFRGDQPMSAQEYGGLLGRARFYLAACSPRRATDNGEWYKCSAWMRELGSVDPTQGQRAFGMWKEWTQVRYLHQHRFSKRAAQLNATWARLPVESGPIGALLRLQCAALVDVLRLPAAAQCTLHQWVEVRQEALHELPSDLQQFLHELRPRMTHRRLDAHGGVPARGLRLDRLQVHWNEWTESPFWRLSSADQTATVLVDATALYCTEGESRDSNVEISAWELDSGAEADAGKCRRVHMLCCSAALRVAWAVSCQWQRTVLRSPTDTASARVLSSTVQLHAAEKRHLYWRVELSGDQATPTQHYTLALDLLDDVRPPDHTDPEAPLQFDVWNEAEEFAAFLWVRSQHLSEDGRTGAQQSVCVSLLEPKARSVVWQAHLDAIRAHGLRVLPEAFRHSSRVHIHAMDQPYMPARQLLLPIEWDRGVVFLRSATGTAKSTLLSALVAATSLLLDLLRALDLPVPPDQQEFTEQLLRTLQGQPVALTNPLQWASTHRDLIDQFRVAFAVPDSVHVNTAEGVWLLVRHYLLETALGARVLGVDGAAASQNARQTSRYRLELQHAEGGGWRGSSNTPRPVYSPQWWLEAGRGTSSLLALSPQRANATAWTRSYGALNYAPFFEHLQGQQVPAVEQQRLFARHQRVICSLESIEKVSRADPYHSLLLDEPESLMRRVGGATFCRRDAPPIESLLTSLDKSLRCSYRVLLADHHLGEDTIADVLRARYGSSEEAGREAMERTDDQLHLVYNAYRGGRATVWMLRARDQFRLALVDVAQYNARCTATGSSERALPIYLHCNHRSEALVCEAILRRYDPDASRLLIHASNKYGDAQQRALTQPNSWIQYRYLVSTPTLQSALDHNPPTPHFALQMVFAGAHTTSARDVVQAMGRVRRTRFQLVILFAATGQGMEEPASQTSVARLQQRAVRTAIHEERTRFQLEVSTQVHRTAQGGAAVEQRGAELVGAPPPLSTVYAGDTEMRSRAHLSEESRTRQLLARNREQAAHSQRSMYRTMNKYLREDGHLVVELAADTADLWDRMQRNVYGKEEEEEHPMCDPAELGRLVAVVTQLASECRDAVREEQIERILGTVLRRDRLKELRKRGARNEEESRQLERDRVEHLCETYAAHYHLCNAESETGGQPMDTSAHGESAIPAEPCLDRETVEWALVHARHSQKYHMVHLLAQADVLSNRSRKDADLDPSGMLRSNPVLTTAVTCELARAAGFVDPLDVHHQLTTGFAHRYRVLRRLRAAVRRLGGTQTMRALSLLAVPKLEGQLEDSSSEEEEEEEEEEPLADLGEWQQLVVGTSSSTADTSESTPICLLKQVTPLVRAIFRPVGAYLERSGPLALRLEPLVRIVRVAKLAIQRRHSTTDVTEAAAATPTPADHLVQITEWLQRHTATFQLDHAVLRALVDRVCPTSLRQHRVIVPFVLVAVLFRVYPLHLPSSTALREEALADEEIQEVLRRLTRSLHRLAECQARDLQLPNRLCDVLGLRRHLVRDKRMAAGELAHLVLQSYVHCEAVRAWLLRRPGKVVAGHVLLLLQLEGSLWMLRCPTEGDCQLRRYPSLRPLLEEAFAELGCSRHTDQVVVNLLRCQEDCMPCAGEEDSRQLYRLVCRLHRQQKRKPKTSTVRVVERTNMNWFASMGEVRAHCLPENLPMPPPHTRVLVVDMRWLCQEYGETDRYGELLKRWESTVSGAPRNTGQLGLLCWRLKPHRERRDQVDLQGPTVCIRTGVDVVMEEADEGEDEKASGKRRNKKHDYLVFDCVRMEPSKQRT